MDIRGYDYRFPDSLEKYQMNTAEKRQITGSPKRFSAVSEIEAEK